MTFYSDLKEGKVWSNIAIPGHLNGYPGIAHGGIVSAILDETAGRAVMLEGDINDLFVTAKLEVTYRNPTPTGQPLTVVGWAETHSSKRATVAAEIRLEDGTVTAECKALVVKPREKFMSILNSADKPYVRIYDD